MIVSHAFSRAAQVHSRGVEHASPYVRGRRAEMLDFEHGDANKNERVLSALPEFGGTYNAHIRDTLFVLLCIRSPPPSVFYLRLSEVGEFDRVDDLWLRVDVLRIGCCIWVCVVPVVEATIHLKNVPSVLGINGSSVSRH